MPRCFGLWLNLVLAWGLTACGGGGSGPTPLNVSAGVYNTTANNDELLVILVRNSVDAQTPNWFGLKFTNNSLDPDLYSGQLTGLGGSTVSGAITKHFQNNSGLTRTGRAVLTMPLDTRLSNSLSLDADGVESASSLSWQTDGLSSNQYVFAVSAAPNLTGSWMGRWSYGAGSAGNQTFTLNLGQATAGQSVGNNCPISSAQLTPLENNVNVYGVQLNIAAATLCTAFGQAAVSLKGLAYVTTSPIAGKTKRLNLVAVSASGKGIFFRGDL